jgi:hypothetical protein
MKNVVKDLGILLDNNIMILWYVKLTRHLAV